MMASRCSVCGGLGGEDVRIHHVSEGTQGWRKRCIKTFEEKKYSFFFFFVLTPYASPFLIWEAAWILILKDLVSDDTAPDGLPPADTIQFSFCQNHHNTLPAGPRQCCTCVYLHVSALMFLTDWLAFSSEPLPCPPPDLAAAYR